MSKIYVTADLHFFHKNILRYNPATRPYQSVEHMNESMVADWNAIVTRNDHVYILGDVAFSSGVMASEIMDRLNGNLHLVLGNHDSKLINCFEFCQRFATISSYKEINHKGTKVVMFHFPILEWNACTHNSVQIHGHTHGNPTGLEEYKVMDVGVDATGKIVVLLDDVIEQLKDRKLKSH